MNSLVADSLNGSQNGVILKEQQEDYAKELNK